MIYDLSVKEVVLVIDVRNARRVKIQCSLPQSTSAVVEAKRGFCYKTSTPRVSFATAKTLVLDGSNMTVIDVTNTAYLHIEVTTADSGKQFALSYEVSGSMRGDVLHRRLDAQAAEIAQEPIYTGSNIRAFCMARADVAVSTAAFEVRKSVHRSMDLLDFSPVKSLSLDGSTVLALSTRDAPIVTPVCTASQANQMVDLWVYMREEVVNDQSCSGDEFPEDPEDWQQFRYTAEGFEELFYWDPNRGKWLGELRQWSFSRTGSLTGTFTLRIAGANYWTSTNGMPTPFQLTWTGYEFHSEAAFTADVQAMEGSSTLVGEVATGSSSQFQYAYDVDIDFDADSGTPHKWWRLSISTGTSTDLVGTMYARRSYTPA